MHTLNNQTKDMSLEALRGIAVMLVLFEHYVRVFLPDLISQTSPVQLDSFVGWVIYMPPSLAFDGQLGLTIFLVLSGYLFASRSEGMKTNQLSHAVFSRILRVYLPALALVVISVPLLGNMIGSMHLLHKVNTTELIAFYPESEFALQNSFMTLFNGIGLLNVMYHFQLYILGPEVIGTVFIMALMTISASSLMRIVALLSLTIPILIFGDGNAYFGWSYFAPIFVGALVYEFQESRFHLPNYVLGMLLVSGLFLASLNSTGGVRNPIWGDYIGLVGIPQGLNYNLPLSIALFYLVLNSNVVRKGLDLKILHFLGKISFSMYLTHVVVMLTVVVPVFLVISIVLSPVLALWLSWVLLLITTIGISFVFYKVIDEPTLKLAKIAKYQRFSVETQEA